MGDEGPRTALSLTVGCTAGREHAIRWVAGHLELEPHDDAEDVLRVLVDGLKTPCDAFRETWVRAIELDDVFRALTRAPAPVNGHDRASPRLQRLLDRLPGEVATVDGGDWGRVAQLAPLMAHELPDCWSAELVATRARRWADPAKWAAVLPRDRATIGEAIGRVLRLDDLRGAHAVHVAPLAIAHVDQHRLVLPPEWIVDVWQRGAAHIAGRPVLSLTSTNDAMPTWTGRLLEATGTVRTTAVAQLDGEWRTI